MANRNFGGRKRRKQWSTLSGGDTDFVGNATSLFPSSKLGSEQTVLRILGEYIIDPTAAPTVNDSCEIAIGIGVVSVDAFTLGATAMPDPGSDNYPWLYWASHAFFFRSTSLDPSSAAATVRRSFDVKSMRVLPLGTALVAVAQYADIAGTPPMTITLTSWRVLVALP